MQKNDPHPNGYESFLKFIYCNQYSTVAIASRTPAIVIIGRRMSLPTTIKEVAINSPTKLKIFLIMVKTCFVVIMIQRVMNECLVEYYRNPHVLAYHDLAQLPHVQDAYLHRHRMTNLAHGPCSHR